MKLSKKYIDFLKDTSEVIVMEGTTAAGKTTVGAPKFMFEVAKSTKRLHVLSGLDLGTIEKNIITKDYGILEVFDGFVEYNASGKGQHSLPHIVYQTPNGEKIIYVVGYDNKTRWKKVLGGQYGCLMIDEANVADINFLREIMMRRDFALLTLNPDDPNLPVYEEFVNKCRPKKKYKDDVPLSIMNDLQKVEPNFNWSYWFFSFFDNAALTKEKREQIMSSVAKGTKQYKNKIQGLRGRHTGLVFEAFDENVHVVTKKWLQARMDLNYNGEDAIRFDKFACGVDTSYSRKSDDAIAFSFIGITTKGIKITLETVIYNNKDRAEKGLNTYAPTDVVVLLAKFLDRMKDEYGLAHAVYIDNADQATFTEVEKYKRDTGCIYQFVPSYKKTKIIDRIQLESGWLATGYSLIVREGNEPLIAEMNVYNWQEKKQEPEDSNDHTINANQYAWLPYKYEIGGNT